MSKNPQPLTVREQLLLAAQVIKRTGWGKGGRGYRGLCLLEALAVVQHRSRWTHVEVPPVLSWVCQTLQVPEPPVAWWRRIFARKRSKPVLPLPPPDSYVHGADEEARLSDVWKWNDCWCSSKEEAIELLETVAEIA